MPTPKHRSAERRAQLWNVLHHGTGSAGRVFSYGLMILILLSLLIIPLEFIPEISEGSWVLIALESVLTIVFTVEYGLRIYAAPQRFGYIFSVLGIIDLLSILPFYLGMFGTQYLRSLRLFRLIRILKLCHMESAAVSGKEQPKEIDLLPGEHVDYVIAKHPIVFIFNALLAVICFAAGLVFMVMMPSLNAIVITVASVVFIFAVTYFYKILLDYNYDVIYVTSHRLIFQNWHLVGRNTNQVSYRSITNVKPHYIGIFSYVLRYGSICIETPSVAAGKIEYNFVKKHEEAAQAIMEKCFSGQGETQA